MRKPQPHRTRSMAKFLVDHVVPTGDELDIVTTQELVSSYNNWARANGYQEETAYKIKEPFMFVVSTFDKHLQGPWGDIQWHMARMYKYYSGLRLKN